MYYNPLRRNYIPDRPLVVFGSGLEDVDFFADHLSKETQLLKKASFIGVRDPYAKSALQKYGLDSIVIGDPVLYLCHPRTRTRNRRRLGINVGYDSISQGDQDVVNQTICNFILKLLETDWQIELFAMNERDEEEIAQVVAGLPRTRINVWKDYLDSDEFQRRIVEYDLVIGQRLHAVVTATGCGIPSLSLTYLPKCLHFMESIKMERFVINTGDMKLTILENLFDELLHNYKAIHNQLVTQTNKYRLLQEKYAREVRRIIINDSLQRDRLSFRLDRTCLFLIPRLRLLT